MSEDGTNPLLFSDAPDTSETPLPMEPSAQLSAGAQLAQWRQVRGWTVLEVADQLNLAPRQVQAIEADNHAALPGLAVTRGFIRAYAKLLKVDPAPMLAEMVANPPATNAATPPRRTLPQTHYSDNRLNSVTSHKTGSRWYAALLSLVVLVGLGSVAQRPGWLPQDLDTAVGKLTTGLVSLRGGGADTPIETAMPAVSASVSATQALPSADTGSVPSSVIAPMLPQQIQTPSTMVQSEPMRADKASPAAPALVGAPLAGAGGKNPSNALVLTFRTDSWVEIKGRGKNTAASKMYRAGTVETFDVSDPVQLLVGNAAGVDATLRGVPLRLAATAKNNVARLSLK